MGVTYDEAEQLLHAWTPGAALRGHARAVEAAMRAAAHRYGRGAEDEERWAITGLLHDADYEQWPDEHPGRIVAWLRARGEPEIADAVAAHVDDPSAPPETPLARALLACDELSGFVVACALVRPEGLATLAASSVRKKLKDRGFAAKVDRGTIQAAVERLGVGLDEQIGLVIAALRPHAAALGAAGRPRDAQSG